jgi:hypothetical protein
MPQDAREAEKNALDAIREALDTKDMQAAREHFKK